MDVTCNERAYAQARADIAFVPAVLGVAGLLFLSAQLRLPLPFSPAPFTLQVLVVLAAPWLLGSNRAFAGTALYLGLGLTGQAAGIALFAVVSGATYGYLLGFLLTPWLMARFPHTSAGMCVAMVCASGMILLLGALWLQFFLGCSLMHAAAIGFLPFVPGDLVKIGLAHALVRRYGGAA